jgi:hypothetical protein
MASLDLFLYRKLQERIEEEIRTRIETLSSGSAQTLEEYKHQVGYIKGLKDSLIWAKETNDELVGRTEKSEIGTWR